MILLDDRGKCHVDYRRRTALLFAYPSMFHYRTLFYPPKSARLPPAHTHTCQDLALVTGCWYEMLFARISGID